MVTTDTTQSQVYTDRLVRLQNKWWKRLLPVQAPYRYCLRSLKPGFTLDIGCGIGRSLAHIDGNGVGIDHNRQSVEATRSLGYTAFTTEDFDGSEYCVPNRFDSLLLSHVVEHLTEEEAASVIGRYLPLLRDRGQVIVITPQEVGYGSDTTHVTFADFASVARVFEKCQLTVGRQFSFPFPRWVGNYFIYNEFVTSGRRK